MFPKDPRGFAIDDQYFIGGSGLLVKPVTNKGIEEVQMYLPENQVRIPDVLLSIANHYILQPYYDYYSYHLHQGSTLGRHVKVPAPLSDIPLLIRGGSIVPTRERPRRSSPLMKRDPFTLHVALDKKGRARGELYLDDGETYEHQMGNFIWREFVADDPITKPKTLHLTSKDLASVAGKKAVHGGDLAAYAPTNNFSKSVENVRVEKVVILGLNTKPVQVKTDNGDVLQWVYEEGVAASSTRQEGVASVLTIKDPGVLIVNDWTILIE